jgi:hypothetical protein
MALVGTIGRLSDNPARAGTQEENELTIFLNKNKQKRARQSFYLSQQFICTELLLFNGLIGAIFVGRVRKCRSVLDF